MPQHDFDSVLLVAFGGPTPGCCHKYASCPGEAFCFVEGILGASASKSERVNEVASHYSQLGGFSPFNELTGQQANSLGAALSERGVDVPVYTGFRHWSPFVNEVIPRMVKNGHRNILAIIMAPHQSKVSWDWYQQTVTDAIGEVEGEKPVVNYIKPWFSHRGYISAISELIREAAESLSPVEFGDAMLVFTAHAIPQAAANASPYTRQFGRTASLVSVQLDRERYHLAYQSGPEHSPIPWTQPDINDFIRERCRHHFDTVIASPIGFLCDHVEVLYDLDLVARATAEKYDLNFIRARTVGSHPEFINMLADLCCDRVDTDQMPGL
ncbi:MAG: ferrochelatase [Candidatus Poribacteria bacterium]|nr:ferrochelatase [Candidatus Poribacteria bacterium]MDE0503989.1 ferrochelatase [Candidatus Poribacteria bacterium]